MYSGHPQCTTILISLMSVKHFHLSLISTFKNNVVSMNYHTIENLIHVNDFSDTLSSDKTRSTISNIIGINRNSVTRKMLWFRAKKK